LDGRLFNKIGESLVNKLVIYFRKLKQSEAPAARMPIEAYWGRARQN
jgi:hypothetical protein